MAEFKFDVKHLFAEPVVKVTSAFLHGRHSDSWVHVIDEVGKLSAKAQHLKHPITTADRLMGAPEQVLYMLGDTNIGPNGAVIGLLKIGLKSLMLCDGGGVIRNVRNAPCILDFYVHETQQRRGYGKVLFESMLGDQKVAANQYCIDRPSPKMLCFLKKHYGLAFPIKQANNYVVYKGFFEGNAANGERYGPKRVNKCKKEIEELGERYSTQPKTHSVSNFLHHL